MTVKIRAAIEKDVERVIECQLEVLEGLRGIYQPLLSNMRRRASLVIETPLRGVLEKGT